VIPAKSYLAYGICLWNLPRSGLKTGEINRSLLAIAIGKLGTRLANSEPDWQTGNQIGKPGTSPTLNSRINVRLELSMRTRLSHLAAKLSLVVFAWIAVACNRSAPDNQAEQDQPQMAPGVAMRDMTFFSPALGRQMPYRVFLPEKIEAGRKLPVVYLLHGNGGDYRDWSNHSNVAQYAAQGLTPGLILVMPEGKSSYFMNAVEKPKDRYEDFITHDLVQQVEANFPASSERASRAIVGVSMGGFAAVKFAFSYPGEFAFAGAISPAIDVTERRFNWKRIRKWAGFREIFGPYGSPGRLAHDPFRMALSADPHTTPYLYLTAGQQEPLLAPIIRFAARLKQQGIPHEFHTHPGGHDWPEWNTQIPDCFASLIAHLNQSRKA
jgi:putative tributyrin esterase